MSEEIIKVLDSLCEKFGIAIDWTSQNVKPYLQELFVKYTNYEMATSIMWLVIFVMILVAGVLFIRWSLKNSKNYVEEIDADAFIFIATLTSFIICIISVIAICCQVSDVIKCCTFPEKMIIDGLQMMINGQ